jgi:hypothetical protein
MHFHCSHKLWVSIFVCLQADISLELAIPKYFTRIGNSKVFQGEVGSIAKNSNLSGLLIPKKIGIEPWKAGDETKILKI